MAAEIELKLRATPGDLPILTRALEALGASKSRAVRLENTYFDTAEGALLAGKIALRLRRCGRRWLQTVKTAGTVKAGVSCRQEWETAYRGAFDFAAVEDAALRGWLQKNAGQLVPVFTTNFKRTRWQLQFAGAKVEVAFDEGQIACGAQVEPICEIECELLSGPADALTALAQVLAGQGLNAAENRSKAQRGYALAARAGAVMPLSSRLGKVSTPTPEASEPAEMDLLLWRHAQAEDGHPDEARALTERGHQQAQQVAAWLSRHRPKKLRVMVSPAQRALQTVRAFTDQFEIARQLAPGASVADVLATIDWPHTRGAVLVVGHQPTLGRLAALLLGGEEAEWSIKKGALWWLTRRVREGEPQTVLRVVVAPEFL